MANLHINSDIIVDGTGGFKRITVQEPEQVDNLNSEFVGGKKESDFQPVDDDLTQIANLEGKDGYLAKRDGTWMLVGAMTPELTYNSNVLTSDVQLVNANQFYQVLQVTLPAGTYMIMADVVIKNTSGVASNVTAKIHTGTSNYASSIINRTSSFDSMSMHCFMTATANQVITLSVAATTATNNYVDAAADFNAAGNTMTKLSFARIG